MDARHIYRSAKLLIEQYGTDAAIHAAMKADAKMERGDMQGYAVWKLIVKAIAEIQTTEGRTKH